MHNSSEKNNIDSDVYKIPAFIAQIGVVQLKYVSYLNPILMPINNEVSSSID